MPKQPPRPPKTTHNVVSSLLLRALNPYRIFITHHRILMPSLCCFLQNDSKPKTGRGGNTIELEMILKIILLGLIHWALVPIALKGLIERERVLGGWKLLWAVPIVFITCLGPLSYLIIHELLPQPQTQLDYDR